MACGLVWLNIEEALRIKETTEWHKMLQPADVEGTAVWFTFSKLVQMSSGFYFGLEWGQRLTNWQLTNGLPAFIELGKGNQNATQLPLVATHTHTQWLTYMPLKSDEEGTDCGHIYKKTLPNSSLQFQFPRQIYDGLYFSFGVVNILLSSNTLILSAPVIDLWFCYLRKQIDKEQHVTVMCFWGGVSMIQGAQNWTAALKRVKGSWHVLCHQCCWDVFRGSRIPQRADTSTKTAQSFKFILLLITENVVHLDLDLHQNTHIPYSHLNYSM